MTDPISFTAKDYGADASSEVAPTLRAGTHDRSHMNGGGMPAVVSFHQKQTPIHDHIHTHTHCRAPRRGLA